MTAAANAAPTLPGVLNPLQEYYVGLGYDLKKLWLSEPDVTDWFTPEDVAKYPHIYFAPGLFDGYVRVFRVEIIDRVLTVRERADGTFHCKAGDSERGRAMVATCIQAVKAQIKLWESAK